ncbi:glycerate 2-kinase, partial [mine drainage metagenome]
AAIGRLGRDVEAIVAVPRGYPAPGGRCRVVWGNHPVPGPGSLAAGRALWAAARAAEPADRLLFLVSGGGSATAELPVARLDLDDCVRTTEVLLDGGAPIQAMNAVRRHLSQLKGGRLAMASRAGRFATVAISDVVGDPPGDVASGPTVPDPTTYADALRAGRRYGFLDRLPAAARRALRDGAAGRLPETPKPED